MLNPFSDCSMDLQSWFVRAHQRGSWQHYAVTYVACEVVL